MTDLQAIADRVEIEALSSEDNTPLAGSPPPADRTTFEPRGEDDAA